MLADTLNGFRKNIPAGAGAALLCAFLVVHTRECARIAEKVFDDHGQRSILRSHFEAILP